MSEHDPQAGFRRLWPVVVLEREVPGHAGATAALERHILALDARDRGLTLAYRRDDFLSGEDPSVAWLARCINVTVRDYFAHVGVDYEVRWWLHAWPNVNRYGDYHDYHNHPRAYLSGTYYVAVPAPEPRSEGRRDARPGHITLYDPRPGVNMTAIRGDPYVEPEYTVLPRAGLIMMWPAFLNHFVHPNLSRDPRISVSFNVMLEWSEAYLPEQQA